MDPEERLDDIERRLDRLERLAFMTFQDVRAVADYAYKNVRLELTGDEIKRMPSFLPLSDREALSAGLMFHELAALKMTARVLRKQIRLDAVGIVRDLMRRTRAATGLEEVSHGSAEPSAEGRRPRANSVPPMSARESRTADMAR